MVGRGIFGLRRSWSRYSLVVPELFHCERVVVIVAAVGEGVQAAHKAISQLLCVSGARLRRDVFRGCEILGERRGQDRFHNHTNFWPGDRVDVRR